MEQVRNLELNHLQITALVLPQVKVSASEPPSRSIADAIRVELDAMTYRDELAGK